MLRKVSLTQWIFVGLLGGFLLGLLAPTAVPYVKPFRGLFLNGVKCIIAPLLFGTLVTGIAGSGSAKQLGRMGARAFIYFEIVTTLALGIGLIAVNLLQPGVGLSIGQGTGAQVQQATARISFGGFVEHLLPSNIVDPIAKGDVLQLVLFTSIFAVGVLAVGERARPVLAFCEALSEVMFRVTAYLMRLAPLGVGAAIAASVAEHGWKVIVPLLKLVGSLYMALFVFILLVLLPAARLFRVPLRRFYQAVKDPVVLAFATTSSESALPMALEHMERFGVPRRIGSFVLPMGYSFNLDGSTLYLAVASVFVAQAAKVELSVVQQLLMMGTLMLTTKGVAAVPRASLVVLSGTLTSFGLPLEGVALILGVDELMDMARTAVNLLGNCLATAVVARWEGIELPEGSFAEAAPPEAPSLAEALREPAAE
ncbi:MAG TPA: cation:dicarboxylase symporter family transporter [Polyangia bacterium]|nr:cation:dicarboxylase symporter family transporter [Polyangia bacterium]